MSGSGVFLLLAVLVGCALFILWPLLAPRKEAGKREAASPPDQDLIAGLQAEHEAILIALRDLDFDYQTGKFSKEDYAVQRETLVQLGVEVLKRIDATRSDLIEQAVRRRRHV
jgi:hypothetical protein